jgi:hypothetical protein
MAAFRSSLAELTHALVAASANADPCPDSIRQPSSNGPSILRMRIMSSPELQESETERAVFHELDELVRFLFRGLHSPVGTRPVKRNVRARS